MNKLITPLVFVIFQLGLISLIAYIKPNSEENNKTILYVPWNCIDGFKVLNLINFFILIYIVLILFKIKSLIWWIFSPFVVYIFVIGFIRYLFKKKYKFNIKKLGWSYKSIQKNKKCLFFLIVCTFLIELFRSILSLKFYSVEILINGFSSPFVFLYQYSFSLFIFLSILRITLGPIAEELCFRGILLPVFINRVGVKWGIIASIAIFVAFHHTVNVSLIFYSFIFVYFYYKKNSLISNIILHSSLNLIKIIVFLFYNFLGKV